MLTARQNKHSDDWYIRATSNEQVWLLEVPLTFLEADNQYRITRYQDAPDAYWQTNPMAYEINQQTGEATDTLTLRLQPGGGAALKLHKLTLSN